MIIYSSGFVALYTIFALLYAHAYRLRDALGLNAMEVHETYGVTRQHVAMTLIGVLSLALGLPRRAGALGDGLLPDQSSHGPARLGARQTAQGARRGAGRGTAARRSRERSVVGHEWLGGG